MAGIKCMWFVGDNFVTTTFRNSFKLAVEHNYKYFTKEQFKVDVYCNNRFNSSNTNVLSRLQNTIAATINGQNWLPDFMVIILDADLIDYLSYKSYGVSSIIGEWVDWLFKDVHCMLSQKFNSLPAKAKTRNMTQVYWVAAPNHVNFTDDDWEVRHKFNNCMEAVANTFGNEMRIVKLKEHWDYKNSLLLVNNRFTNLGHKMYWVAVDAAVKFNVLKKEEFCEVLRLSNGCSTWCALGAAKTVTRVP